MIVLNIIIFPFYYNIEKGLTVVNPFYIRHQAWFYFYAERVTRTPNHLITEELRYQLRHSGIIELEIGLEPTTCGLLNRYSTS